ncbi:response regulator [Nocardia crassostreae]|uniref:response regulator n=1 Tax=Nocardia crassostreae TaxID=53428 RepID=UPI00083600D3|nr:response regulator transcription factor [Nocardia crassostreae]
MTTVFVVDDHEIVRRGLIDLIEADPDLTVIGQADTVARALTAIPAMHPDIAVLDIRLPDGNGIELCRELLSGLDDLRCLMLTSFTDERGILDALLAGADGYVVKDIRGAELVKAIKDVAAGQSMLDNRAAATLIQQLRRSTKPGGLLAGLTERERGVFDLLGDGLTNRQIAATLFLTEKTVKNHVSRLLAKLGVEHRTQAALLASKLRAGRSHPVDQ